MRPKSYNVVHLKGKCCAGHSIHVLVYFASKNIFCTFGVARLAEKYKITAWYSLVHGYRKVSTKCLRLQSGPRALIHLPEHQDTQ